MGKRHADTSSGSWRYFKSSLLRTKKQEEPTREQTPDEDIRKTVKGRIKKHNSKIFPLN